MPAKQRMRVANEKHSQNVNTRGNVPKSLVSGTVLSREKNCHQLLKTIGNMKRLISSGCKLKYFHIFRNHKKRNIPSVLFFLDYSFSSYVDQVRLNTKCGYASVISFDSSLRVVRFRFSASKAIAVVSLHDCIFVSSPAIFQIIQSIRMA